MRWKWCECKLDSVNYPVLIDDPVWGNWYFYVNATMYLFHWLEIEKNQKHLFIKKWLLNCPTKALQKYYQIFSSISIYFLIIWTITQFPKNIFILFDILDPHGPICSRKTSFLFIVPIPWSHVIARMSVTKVSQHFKLWPNPIVTTVNVSYLHNHRLSWAHIWWESRLVSWLQVSVLGLSWNNAQPEILESQDTHSNSDSNCHWMLNNSTTTAPFDSILVLRHSPGPCPSISVLRESDVTI